jgi:uncharacterized membrane protein YbhN (UPF0104 family)
MAVRPAAAHAAASIGTSGHQNTRSHYGTGSHQGTSSATRTRRRLVPVLGGAAVLGAAALLAVQLRNAELGTVLGHLSWIDLAIAIGFMALSLFAAAYNLLGFSPLHLKLLPTLSAQLAVSGLRIVAPSAISTPAIATRYLSRSGATTPDALATVAAAQTAQFFVTTGLVAVLGVVSGAAPASARGLVSLNHLLWVGVGGALLIGAAVLAARTSPRVARLLAGIRESASMLIRHARHRPGMVSVGLSASAALTVTHVLAFAYCVSAVGGHASYLSLLMIYLASASAGSLIPTPGGVGAVEAALIAGLTATGMALPVAAAGALLSRLVSVWLLAVPGWFALVGMRRRGLL